MEGHVADLDHYIAGQSCGAEPDEHRHADQRSHNNKSPHKQKEHESNCFACHAWPLELAAAAAGGGCGCGCSRAISRVFFLLPCIVERSSQEPHQAGISWKEQLDRGIQGRAKLASLAIMVSYLSRCFVLVGGVKDSQVGEDEDKMAFLVFLALFSSEK